MRRTSPHGLDEAIIEFGRSWYGYGGGSDEDIYVAFGMEATTYFERLLALLDSSVTAELDDETRTQMRVVCATRLR